MKDLNPLAKKIGILGGGQLGKMLCEAASSWHLPLQILESKDDCPAALIAPHFHLGSFRDPLDVENFGKDLEAVGIEIETVSTEGLEKLEKLGIHTSPTSSNLRMIKDKGLQNEFYVHHDIPCPEFQFFDSSGEIREKVQEGRLNYPFVQKLRTEGYDGRGVAIIRTEKDLNNLMDGACIVEEAVDIQKELGIIVARDHNGNITTYDPVEMVFHPGANLVEYLRCPANIPTQTQKEISNIASNIIKELGHIGILAIEFFLDRNGKIHVNEMAPRPHNSGHHTIEACQCSQFEQMLRVLGGFPLGDTSLNSPAVMVNLLGEEGENGPAVYEGLNEVMTMKNVYIHIYGKSETRPKRKMGHITILEEDIDQAIAKGQYIREIVKVRT